MSVDRAGFGSRSRALTEGENQGPLGHLRRGARALRTLLQVLAADSYGRVGMGILAFFCVLAVVAPLIVPFDPWANNYRSDGGLARLDGISWHHLLGTTFYGQDVYSQLVLGTRQTLLVGFIAAILILPRHQCRPGLRLLRRHRRRRVDADNGLLLRHSVPALHDGRGRADRSQPAGDHRIDGLHLLAHRRARGSGARCSP